MTRPSRTIPLLAAGLASLMLPVSAFAAGMPQLNFNTPLTLSQVVWGAIIFVVLYLLLAREGLPLVGSVLEERAARIGKDLQEARGAKARADSGMAEAEQATAKARAEAQAAINTALDQAKQAAAAQSEALNARLDRQLHEAEGQIAQARTQAMGALRQVATETAETVIVRLTGSAPDRGKLDQAIGSALTSRGIS